MGSTNPSLSCRVHWDGSTLSPERPANRKLPDMIEPVDENNIRYYVSLLVDLVKERAAWFRTSHLLWPWVRQGPTPQCSQRSPGLLSSLTQLSAFGVLARLPASAPGQCLFPAHHTPSSLPPAPPTTWDSPSLSHLKYSPWPLPVPSSLQLLPPPLPI